MKMIRRCSFLTVVLITSVATLWPTPVTAQQFFPAGRRELTLSTGFVSGRSSFSLNLSTGLPTSPFDLLFRINSLSSAGTTATSFLVGGRYTLGIETPLVRPFVLAGVGDFVPDPSGSPWSTIPAFVFGGGASLTFPGPVDAYGSLVYKTGAGGLGYDVGVQYAIAPRFSLLVGISGVNVSSGFSSAAYAGLSLRF